MRLTRLRVYNYRNFREEETLLSPGTNLLLGRNGQGKTNLLEAIYILGYGKSFRTSTPRDCILHGESVCRVEGTVEHGSLERDLQVEISLAEKKLLLRGREVPIDEFVGNLHLLAFTNDHLAVVRGAPSHRRAFLDRAMATLYPTHLRNLASYGRALKQRNRVLASQRGGRAGLDEEYLQSWEETLVRDGARILWNRMTYVARIKEELPQGLFGDDSLKLRYLSNVSRDLGGSDELERRFREKLREVRSADLQMGFTTAGPHRDDLKLFVNGKSLAEFGSAGQQRSALLSLYFSQMEIHRKCHGFYPLFLVDDVEAELDEARLRTFLSYLSERTQTFLTTAKEGMIPAIGGDVRRFEIMSGTIHTGA